MSLALKFMAGNGRTLIAAALVFAGSVAALPVSQVPAALTFNGGSIDGDGLGVYVDGDACVNTWFDSRRGNLYFRTISFDCSQGAPAERMVLLDFSQPVSALNHCDDTSGGGCLIRGFGNFDDRWLNARGPNLLPDVRLLAGTLFSRSSTSLELTFDLGENYFQSGGQDAQFQVTFASALPVIVAADGTRSVVNQAVLARLNVRVGKKLAKVGDYLMPFSITAGAK